MYHPGGYSDSDEYDEYDMEYDKPVSRPFRIVKSAREELEDEMYNAVVEGDLEPLQNALASVEINLDDRLKIGYSLLMYACLEAQSEIVRYLIEKGATVNMEIESYTPLMMACLSEKKSELVTDVVKQLLENGAVVNQSNLYGDTPLIFASQNGHTEVVRQIIKDASLDACNNQSGNSAIFYAIEKNHLEIVKLLLEHGASFQITNHKGYFPKVVAKLHGFLDIVALFPQEEDHYQIPDTYTRFQHYTDLVPGILRKPIAPPYFYRIREILNGLELESLLIPFAKSGTSLPQFLTMNEQKLAEAGIDLPILQKKVMHGLFRLHARKWSKQSVSLLKNESHVDTFHLYAMFAGHLQHLVVLRCSLVFLLQLIQDQKVDVTKAVKIAKALDSYLEELDKMFLFVEKIRRSSSKTLPDEITPEKAQSKPKQKTFLNKLIKYSSIFGAVTLLGILLKSRL